MIWRLEYENAHGDIARLDIQKGDATPVEIIEGTENPFLLSYELEDKSKKGFIMSSFADISIYETDTFNIDDLKTLDETALSVKWYINNDLEWTGFVVPDFFSRTIGEPAIVNLVASDRLSSLKDATLDGLSEHITLRDLAIACLAETGLSLLLNTTVDFKAGTFNIMDAFALSSRLEDDKGKKISCFDVLRSILVLTNSTIRQRKGRWRIYNKIQHEALAPTLTFNEVYQGAKRTIQPVFSSVGVFQEFGGTKSYPNNYMLSNSAAGWVAENGFITEFDNRELNYTPYFAPSFGDETNKTNLINRNIYTSGSFDNQKKLSSPPFKVPFRGADSVAFTLEINARGIPGQMLRYVLVKRVDGVPVSFLRNDGTWTPRPSFLYSFFPSYEEEEPISGDVVVGVDAIATIKSDVYLEESEDPDKVTLTLHILGVTAIAPSSEQPIIFVSAIRSAKVVFSEKSDAKGILYRTDQLGDFSKKSNPDTTIFGDFISSGLNGYFYPYSKDESSILHSPLGSNPPLSKWTTATDPDAGELPILQHVTRQMSRMFGVAHNVLSAVIDAKTFDPLAIVTNCAGEKYVIVYSVFDFLRSTVEVELQQIAYGSLQRRDFIFSYFGGGDGDGISSIGSVSGGGSYSGSGGGSFLDKYFSFDEANDALVANVSLVSEKEIAAYFSDGSIPSIFDSIPFATSSKVGGIKAASTFKDGIRINSLGFLEIDPSYADSGVSSWSDLADRPSWLTPTTKTGFEAGHGHTWGQITSKPTSFPPTSHNHPISDITGLQTALNGKLGTGAQAYDSARLGGQLASKYPRRDVAETITGAWEFSSNPITRKANPAIEFADNVASIRARWLLFNQTMRLQVIDYATGANIAAPIMMSVEAPSASFSVISTGYVGIGITSPTEKLHVVGNGLFTGSVAAPSFIGDASNALRLGGHLANLYPRRNVDETISRTWNFNRINTSGYLYMTSDAPRIEFHDTARSEACRWVLVGGYMRLHTVEYGTSVYAGSVVGLSTLAPDNSLILDGSGNLTVLGNLTAKGEVTAYSSSDARLKKNIKPIEDALGIISKLNPIAFNWNEKAVELNEVKNTESINYGVIAQEIEEVLPDLIHETNGFKSVDYPQLFGMLIKAIQELKLEIDNK